ncbi:hypothetical protein SAMN05444161_8286 [Rhizobiales bacterium GAS191]|nr:hypothetical protein SAMN05444161_8286 [Rhizobiales bacterium GAS191]
MAQTPQITRGPRLKCKSTPARSRRHLLHMTRGPLFAEAASVVVSSGLTTACRPAPSLATPHILMLSLTGVRLIIPDHALGLPVLRALSLCTCCRHYPGAADGRSPRSFTHPCRPSPIPLSGRPAHRPFRDSLSVQSRCGVHTCAVTKFVTAIRGLQTFRHLMPAPVVSGWSGCRVGLAPTGKRRLSRRTWEAVIHWRASVRRAHSALKCPRPKQRDRSAGRLRFSRIPI